MLKSKGIITANQRQILTFFSGLLDSQFFYLTGGTALAEFYLGHRLSYDLDLFTTEKQLILPFSRSIEEELKSGGFSTTRDAVDLFFILKKENLWKLAELASKKDPGFDLYWLAVAFERVRDFPDDIERWPVKMALEVKVKELKEMFSMLARKTMDKIKKGEIGANPEE